MNILSQLWFDEQGSVLSAEVATVATIAVLGATAGLSTVTTSINGEMLESAHAFRSLNQSYRVRGFSSCSAYTAGSCYLQPPVAQSLEALKLQSDVVPNDGTVVKPSLQPGGQKIDPKEHERNRRMKKKNKNKNQEVDDIEVDETVSPATDKNADAPTDS